MIASADSMSAMIFIGFVEEEEDGEEGWRDGN